MKGIVLPTIAYFLIAFATIVLIISLINLKFSPSIKHAYCSFLRSLRTLLPLPSYMRPSLPSYCAEELTVKVREIEADDPEKISFLIASYIVACWKETGELNLKKNVTCYELVLTNVKPPGVLKDDVNRTLTEEGYGDILVWRREDVIAKPTSLIISYNSTNKKVEVI